MSSPSAQPPRGSLGLLAAVAGLSVANLYYAQPLAAMMSSSLHVQASALGVAMMLSQLGYALGMLLLVPLGDGRERRALMVRTAIGASGTLLLMAAAPSYPLLAAVSFLLGFASCLPQMVVPFAVGLVPSEERGRAIGLVMGGLLTGILLSRTASGTFGDVFGWRVTFAGAAVLMACTAVVMRLFLPTQTPAEPLPWGAILRSLGAVVRGQPILRRQALVGACGFASFSVFWSTLSFHLATLGYGSRAAGLFGAVGITGVIVAPIAGRIATRGRPTRVNLLGHCAVVLGFGTFWLGARSLLALGLGVVLLDAGVQASHLANQTIVFGLEPSLRNRINAVYMVTYFLGGALGTVSAALVWQRAGWGAVCALGAGFAALGMLPVARRVS